MESTVNFIGIVLRIALAAVFATAGIAKLRDRHATIRMLMAFGVIERVARPLAILLPGAELAASVMLLPPVTAAAAAATALALLLAFSSAIAWNLWQGRRPDCQCFGQSHASPIGWGALARNGALAAGAATVSLTPGAAAGPTGPAGAAAVAAGAALVVAGAWIARLRARVRELEQTRTTTPAGPMQPEAPARAVGGRGLAVGSAAPPFALPNQDGATISLASLLSRGCPVLLVFSDPNCGPCARLLPRLAERAGPLERRLTLAIVSRGAAEAQQTAGLRHVLLQHDREVLTAYRVVGTPSAILLNEDGTIGTAVAAGELEIDRLLDELADEIALSRPPSAEPSGVHAAAEAITSVPSLTATAVAMKADCVHDELLPDGSIVLYNACRRQALTLNATGALIWECCNGRADAAAIADVITEVFPSAVDQARRDVLAILDQLRDAGMITVRDGADRTMAPAFRLATAE